MDCTPIAPTKAAEYCFPRSPCKRKQQRPELGTGRDLGPPERRGAARDVRPHPITSSLPSLSNFAHSYSKPDSSRPLESCI